MLGRRAASTSFCPRARDSEARTLYLQIVSGTKHETKSDSPWILGWLWAKVCVSYPRNMEAYGFVLYSPTEKACPLPWISGLMSRNTAMNNPMIYRGAGFSGETLAYWETLILNNPGCRPRTYPPECFEKRSKPGSQSGSMVTRVL